MALCFLEWHCIHRFLSRSFSHFLPYSLWLWYVSHFPICEDTPAVLLLFPFGIWSKSNSYYIHSKNEIPKSPKKLDQGNAMTDLLFSLSIHVPAPAMPSHSAMLIFGPATYLCLLLLQLHMCKIKVMSTNPYVSLKSTHLCNHYWTFTTQSKALKDI